jgi:hypothetical protein
MKNAVNRCPCCRLRPILIKGTIGFLYDCTTECSFIGDLYVMFEEDRTKEFLFKVPADKESAIQIWNLQVHYFEKHRKEWNR